MRLLLLTLLALTTSTAFADAAPASAPSVTIPIQAAHAGTSLKALGPASPAASGYCCKVCSVGKACANTCISREKTCHVGQGCACDG